MKIDNKGPNKWNLKIDPITNKVKLILSEKIIKEIPIVYPVNVGFWDNFWKTIKSWFSK